MFLKYSALISDSSEEDTNSNSLKDQLNNARKSLRQRSPLRNTTDNNTYFTQSNMSANSPQVDSSNLSVQQRIAMMKGKQLGGIGVISTPLLKTNQAQPKSDSRRNLKPVSRNQSSLKPPTPLKPAGLITVIAA